MISWKPIFVAVSLTCLIGNSIRADNTILFSRDVAPILQTNCVGCHGSETVEGDYRVDTFARLKKPGESEEPSLTAMHPDKSELFLRLVTDDESIRMPLDGDPLPSDQVQVIKKWIEQGAKIYPELGDLPGKK